LQADMCAESPPTPTHTRAHNYMLKRFSHSIKIMQWLMWLDDIIPVSDPWQSM